MFCVRSQSNRLRSLSSSRPLRGLLAFLHLKTYFPFFATDAHGPTQTEVVLGRSDPKKDLSRLRPSAVTAFFFNCFRKLHWFSIINERQSNA
jgi:hypothetical protein